MSVPPFRMQVGPLGVELSLDEALARACGPIAAEPAGAVDARLELTAGSPGSRIAPFGAGHTLQANGIALVREGSRVHGTCEPLLPVIARAVRFALQPLLLERGWLLLHGSSVRLEDGVHVFMAPSGTGKSTLAKRLENAGEALLGDEVALVSEERAAVFPLQPHPGEPGVTGPLAAIHVLAQGGPGSELLTPGKAAARILEMAMVYEDGPGATARAMDVAVRIASKTPAFLTRVPNDERAAAHVLGLARARRAA